MPVNPVICATIPVSGHHRANARRRRRGWLLAALVNLGTWLVFGGLLAIPLFLLWGLGSLPVSSMDWQRLGLLFAGSLRAAVCAVLVALPLGLATAMFSAHFTAPRLRAWLKPALETLDAVPTVVLGLVATATLAPWFKTHVATVLALIAIVPCVLLAAGFAFGAHARRAGWLPLWLLPLLVALVAVIVAFAANESSTLLQPASPWNASLVGIALGMAALPLVYSVAEDALFLVPQAQTQAAFALGATRWQALTTVVLPAAGSGLLAAALLGFSRCFGETMIVLMASGNTPVDGFDLLAGLRSISAELALGLPDAAPHSAVYRNLLLAALTLLATSVLFSLVADVLRERLRRRLQAGGVQ